MQRGRTTWRQCRTTRRPEKCVVDGVGLRGLRAPGVPLDMGNAGTAMRLFMGLLSAQSFDSILIGDESLMRRPMERAATPLRSMGASIETHGWQAARAHPRRRSIARHSLRNARRQRAGQIRGAARGVVRGQARRPWSSRRSRAITPSACCRLRLRIRARDGVVTLAAPRSLQAAQIRVPGDISSAAFFLRRGLPRRARAIHDPRRRRESDAHRHPRDARPDGRRPAPGQSPQLRAWSRWPTSKCARRSCTGCACSRAAGAARRSTSSRRCSSRPRVRKGRRSSPAPRNCASRKATASRPWRAASTCWACSTKCCRTACASSGGRPFGGGTIDSRGDHRIAMAFAVASLRATAPITILDVANVATSFPGFAALANP